MKTSGWIPLLFLSAALQAAPPAPQVTVGADLKQLRFDWLPSAGATRYELWQRAAANGTWLKVQDRPAAATYTIIAVSAHLLDWRGARWRIDACDANGCTPSAEVSATSLMRDSVGFIKSVPVLPPRSFGLATALSADGRTLAVQGNEFWMNTRQLPYVYVYRRVGSNWVFDARLVPDNARDNDTLGTPVALNFDGSVLVWGTQYAEYPNDTGGTVDRGAVYVFRRVGGAWLREHKVTPPPDQTMYLGRDVDVSDDGERFVVSYQSLPYRMGHTQIYRRISGAWQLEKTLTMRTGGSHWAECLGLALSGNGQRVVRYCTRSPHSPALAGKYVETYSAPRWTLEAEIQLGSHIHYPEFLHVIGAIDINGDGTRLVSMHSHESTLSVWRWNGSAWEPDSPTGELAILATPGLSVAMSRNGNLIAQGDSTDDTAGVGAIYPPFQIGVAGTGLARVYERRGGTWTLRQTLKGNTTSTEGFFGQAFGASVALGDNGSVLAVGAKYDNSAATGVDGDQNDTSAPHSGAVWLY
jgi:hypothetical protein